MNEGNSEVEMERTYYTPREDFNRVYSNLINHLKKTQDRNYFSVAEMSLAIKHIEISLLALMAVTQNEHLAKISASLEDIKNRGMYCIYVLDWLYGIVTKILSF